MPLRHLCACAVIVFMLSSCSTKEPDKQLDATASMAPILMVEKNGFRFSMYPEYVDESRSRLKLDIRDKGNLFVKGATVSANLKAQDGHEEKVEFKEDSGFQRYVVDVPLKHHEDYVIDAQVSLDNVDGSSVYTPRFVFHCGDPIPELYDVGDDTGSDRK